MSREVHVNPPKVGDVDVGGVRVPVIAGIDGVDAGGDIVRYGPRSGQRVSAELARVREQAGAPLLVELSSAAQAAVAGPHADGVLIDVTCVQDASAAAALAEPLSTHQVPVVLQRRAPVTVDAWLEAADRLATAGTMDVLLCETGGDGPELAVLQRVREYSSMPVVVEVTSTPELAGAAVAAGAQGIAVSGAASAAEVARVADLATTLAPFGRPVEPGDFPADLQATRHAIDQVDACLADLLERRASLAGLVQQLKPVGGFAGRDRERERALVDAMARRAPRLGPKRMRRIMEVVIEAGLELAETESPVDGLADRAEAAPPLSAQPAAVASRSVGEQDPQQAR